MSDSQDPLAALSAAARGRSTSQSNRTPRPVAIRPQPKSAGPATVHPGRRRQSSRTPIYFAIGGLAIVLLAGIVMTAIILMNNQADAKQIEKKQRPPAAVTGGPGDLFSNVKAQDPAKK